MFQLILLLAVGLLAAILLLWRRELRKKPEQPKQPSDEDAKSSVPELKGEIRSGSIQTVQDSVVLVRVSQTGKCICAPRADTRTRIATYNHTLA